MIKMTPEDIAIHRAQGWVAFDSMRRCPVYHNELSDYAVMLTKIRLKGLIKPADYERLSMPC